MTITLTRNYNPYIDSEKKCCLSAFMMEPHGSHLLSKFFLKRQLILFKDYTLSLCYRRTR